ncbi:hypothetical protein K501DRAFT_278513 [Backusella circina FSU 941]|nr:hypothetical protein K501DRAFT_278513 [Backusella circina FSU 941]
MVTSSNNAFDYKKFEENFMRMKRQHKWYLSTGKCVEDEMFAFGLQYSELHPVHSFIMDPTDTNYIKYNVFSCDELVEIRTYHEKNFPPMPVFLRNYINSFNKNNYDHNTSHDCDWMRITIYQLLREYEAGTLKKHHSEEWYMAHVWNFIDTVFNDVDGATKRLEEGFLKLPKCLKDMLDNILSKVDYFTKVQTLGFIHSGLQSYLVRADRPTKYTTRIAKSRTYHISNDITEFGKSVLPAIYIAWVIKDIVAKMNTIIAENMSIVRLVIDNSSNVLDIDIFWICSLKKFRNRLKDYFRIELRIS